MLIAAHHKLDNLTVIADFNKIQGSGFVKDILPVDSLGEVAKSIGWEVNEVDGHNIDELKNSMNKNNNRPILIIAHTIKGKGVSFMENQPKWHANWPSPEYEKKAIEELSK